MKPDAQTEFAVVAALKAYFEAYSRRDLDAVLSGILPDSDMVSFGTGLDEKYVGFEGVKAGIERDLTQSEGARIELGWHLVSAVGDVAWVAGQLEFHAKLAGMDMVLPVRYTGVLVRRDGKWMLAHQHYSEPSQSQEAGHSWQRA